MARVPAGLSASLAAPFMLPFEAVVEANTGAMQNFRSQGDAGSDNRAGLVVLYADGFSKLRSVYVLDEKRFTIGRDEASSIPLPVTAVSRRHAELSLERGQWIIRDLGSTNGTLVDGQRVTEFVLEPDAELRIGDAIFKLVEREAGAYAEYLLDGRMAPGRVRIASGGTELTGGLQMDRIAGQVAQLAKTPLSVLILGESGTGKEVVARELHEKSRRKGAFSAVNCAALPENLIESELFGYKKGAFSGADRDKTGLIQAAHGGTLLLDEIGDMPLAAQAKLLRVLQAREVLPLGATKPEPVDVRVLAATHRDLVRLQKDGKFRPDLYARLNEYELRLPPLRDRKEDIYQLVMAFAKRHGAPSLVEVSLPFMAGLLHHDWPYNVRELEAAIKRAVALSGGGSLREEHLPDSVREAIEDYAENNRRPASRDTVSENELRQLLEEEAGNIARVGRRLGKARMQIHRWLTRYQISVEEYRK